MKIVDVYLNDEKIMEYPVSQTQEITFSNVKKVWHAKVNPNNVSKQIEKGKAVFTLENGEKVTLTDVQIEYDDTIDEVEFWYTYEKV